MKASRTLLNRSGTRTGLAAAAALVGYMVFLIIASYSSQVALRQAEVDRFVNRERGRAEILSRFFAEKLSEIEGLADGRAIRVYFENKALGMTMTYGLKASIIGIENRFGKFLAERASDEANAFDALVLVDGKGAFLARAGKFDEFEAVRMRNRPPALKPRKTVILTDGPTFSNQAVIAAPCRFKGARVGEVLAWMDLGRVREHFLRPPDPKMKRALADRLELGGADGFKTLPAGNGSEEVLSCTVPVKDTPFSLVSSAPVSVVYHETQPGRLLLATAALGVLILGSAAYFVSVNTRNRVLQGRLAEAAARETEIAGKNRELERYRRNLETMVEERTRQLEETQKELLVQATEAGRAQMVKVILHNIGNAVTPAVVHVKKMKEDGLGKLIGYLDETWRDLEGHKRHLTRYVTKDPRGREVAAYGASLIRELHQYNAGRLEALDTVDAAFSYVGEILALERSYEDTGVLILERLDLNRVVVDALTMQAASAESRDIRVTQELSPDPVMLKLNRNRLMQTLVNLIRNSCEAMDPLDPAHAPRGIVARTFRGDGHAGFEISDSGIGASEEDRKDIFEFGKSGKGSSGFGLSYCREFVEGSGGRITFESRGRGKGAMVRAVFPVYEETL